MVYNISDNYLSLKRKYEQSNVGFKNSILEQCVIFINFIFIFLHCFFVTNYFVQEYRQMRTFIRDVTVSA